MAPLRNSNFSLQSRPLAVCISHGGGLAHARMVNRFSVVVGISMTLFHNMRMVGIVQYGILPINCLAIKLSKYAPLPEIRPIVHECGGGLEEYPAAAAVNKQRKKSSRGNHISLLGGLGDPPTTADHLISSLHTLLAPSLPPC